MQRGLSKAVKKAVVKNHLQGFNPIDNAKSSGAKLTPEEVEGIVGEFGADANSLGLDVAAKEYGVGSIAKDLGEIARFKKENEVDFSEILEGAKIASTLKKFGAGMPEFEQFLSGVYSRSLEKGYTPNEIISQSSKLEALERKYGMAFEKLRENFEETGRALNSKKKEIADIETEIVQVIKKKSDLLSRYSLDEQKIQDYAATKQELLNLGLDLSNLPEIKNFLVSLKNSNFDSGEIIAKLNSISDLQAQKSKIQQEVIIAKREMDEKKQLLGEIQKQVEKFSKQKADIEAYSELRASGVDAKRMQEWNKIIQASNLDFGAIEGELRNQGNLKALEEKIGAKIKDLLAEELRLNQSIAHLSKEKQNLELSAKAIKDTALNEIAALGEKIILSLSSLNEQAQSKVEQAAERGIKSIDEINSTSNKAIKGVGETALSEVQATVSSLKASTTEFTEELRTAIERAGPDIKGVAAALDAGERIGKYRNIVPLLELMDGSVKADESEALIAMWNLTSRFNAWLENQYPNAKREMSKPLTELLESINKEIQRVGGE